VSTPAELRVIADRVLLWVNRMRLDTADNVSDDDLRRIELCAMTTREVSMFHDLYGGGHAPAEEVPE
jgi:hypothetical protein